MNLFQPYSTWTEAAWAARPQVALILGSGMGAVAKRMRQAVAVPFHQIPGLPSPSIPGHTGCLTLGEFAGRQILAIEGRVHFYEGHPWRSVTLPIRIAAQLGARILVLTNAAGGIHEALTPGSFMAIRDHIDWTRPYCWRGQVPEDSPPYSPRMLGLMKRAAEALGIPLAEGVYAAVTGPTYETQAEVQALKAWGADAVGMSTAREVLAAVENGLECAAVSCITNPAAGLGDGFINHGEVLINAGKRSDQLGDLLEEFVKLASREA
jgi:purine-nucleoside phosphorylase